jgi:hypothetical protein
MNQDWPAAARAFIEVWNAVGWKTVGGIAAVVLLWKFIDAWGKRPGR